MRVVKNSIPVIAAMLLSGAAMAATSNGVPTSIVHPVPMQPQSTPARVTQPAAKPAEVYADAPSAQANAQSIPADVNTNIPYASVLPKDAEIVPGAPGKNEFFIVAAEDAAKIKKLIDHTKPGTEILAGEIKSKQPIVKVKLDESNSTLVAMDVVSSVSEVAKAAVKPSVKMTADDEVMSIFTKNRMTPVGSRTVAAVTPVQEKMKVGLDAFDEKPMLKLLASTDATHASASQAHTAAIINPLEATAPVKPAKGMMPDTVAIKQTIQQPQDKPVALPLASKEAAPTLEMVLQQAKNGGAKVKNDVAAATALASAVRAADVKAKKKIAVAGKVIPYETIKPVTKTVTKKGLWSARHAADEAKIKTRKVASKKGINKKVATRKRILNVGVVHSYADYLSKTGHRARHNTE